MAHSPIFRESALARLASPEQLDSMVQVTTTRGWIATITLVASAAAVVVWSIIGEVTTYVKAQGIILNHDGAIIDISAPHNSTLSRILIKGGDRVEAGEVVAETVDRKPKRSFALRPCWSMSDNEFCPSWKPILPPRLINRMNWKRV